MLLPNGKSIKSQDFVSEGNEVTLKCCVNAETKNHIPHFEWSKKYKHANWKMNNISIKSTTNDQQMCSYLSIGTSREDNWSVYKCSWNEKAMKKPLTKSLSFKVSCKRVT